MIAALSVFAAFFTLWILFLAVMHLKEARDSGVLAARPWVIRALAYMVLAVGVVFNLFVRVCLSWVIFWEIPRWGEWAVSAQVKRLCAAGNTRAVWFRDNLLKPFDKSGGHD